MSTPPLNVDEAARLQALAELDMSDAEPDVALTHIVELAARLLGAPTAFVSFVDRDRQIFNAKVGLDLCETARDIAFCNRTIAQDTLLVVRDATRDPRFCDNPLVSGPPFIRFYAGAPLRTRAGHAIGTLCLLGPEPRDAFTDQDRQILADLARLVIDRLELRRAEAGRRATQTRFEHIADTSPDAIVCTDAQGLVSFWSAGAEHMFGHTGAEVLGRSIARLIPDRMAGGSEGLLRRLAQGSAEHLTGRTVELTAEHRDGREFPVELSLSTWRENGVPTHGAIMRDVSQRWAIEERLFRLAHLDPLTELPNRLVLRGRIEAALAQAEPAAVLMFDLDGFKEVNDAHGHAVGDAVLKVTAARLRACAGPDGTAARLGGDEFAIVLPGVGDPLVAVAAAEAALRALAEPYSVDGLVMHLGASAGIALSPAHATEGSEFLACADAALYDAKARGRGQHRLFTPELRAAIQRTRACREGLRRAVLRDEFVLHYQPQVRLSDGALMGAEALIRWQHPEHGLLPPAAFLDVLDNSPDAARIGDWVLRTACVQAEAWRAGGLHPFRIGVNLFAAQFRGGDLAARVAASLAETGLPPEALELEITETIILRHDPQVDAALQALRAMGVGIAFDDYGTGYASLSLLKNFPLTRLKIDRGFVNGLCVDRRDAAIVRAVIDLSRRFGLTVIAEGVETQEQRRRLLSKGCQEAQGYLFGRPMSAEAFAAQYGLAGQAEAPVTRAGSAG
ncbi:MULTISPECIES: putative bifunctional diguanylate cyclase/phosphodiesterase [unclassified Methylobacterium]|jgi:diguanylate cyclase (GGDEF)-like protein/PAS domain S-box-containing protein|uniref:putative bifunctional diguanylate cyclase/phosphodiesterase n=1 Tax=unclassified Methylobacterium TaxID=2615210 RepID=UPI001354A86A|nr:EAL domain-containing protein [Methylobacterium sp. 2A]MWV20603.1 EAL domain-containing protein [Methylobacterium sp. 2A]